MKSKIYQTFALVLVLAWRNSADAAPFHGCTFYKSRLDGWSWPGGLHTGCADFSLDYGACRKVKCFLFGCITYSGTLFTGWFPEYFIEVTSRVGKSAFADAKDGGLLQKQMEKAKESWREHGDVNPTASHARQDIHDNQMDSKLLFARALSVPYGTIGWSFPNVDKSAGSVGPLCYRAISEYVPETWADDLDSGDRELAAAWSSLTTPACLLGAPIVGAINTIAGAAGGGSSDDSSIDIKCALPLSASIQKIKALTGVSAYNPAKQCMGVLGPLLPRTGWTNASDTYTAAQQAAWRLASLSEDYFLTDIGVQLSDKWQVVWPVIPRPQCFTPGSLLRTSTLEPTTFMGDRFSGSPVPIPGTDVPKNQGLSDYVFAIWRKYEKCLEPWDGVAARVDFSVLHSVRSAACSVLNSTDGMP